MYVSFPDTVDEYPSLFVSDQLLFLEEALEMIQLPRTRRTKNNKLKNRPSNNPRIRRL
jgi:hypothetical protein